MNQIIFQKANILGIDDTSNVQTNSYIPQNSNTNINNSSSIDYNKFFYNQQNAYQPEEQSQAQSQNHKSNS